MKKLTLGRYPVQKKDTLKNGVKVKTSIALIIQSGAIEIKKGQVTRHYLVNYKLVIDFSFSLIFLLGFLSDCSFYAPHFIAF